MRATWSDELAGELRRRWQAGQSASVIAAALGVSRDAVIGRINRGRSAGEDLARRYVRMHSQRLTQADKRRAETQRLAQQAAKDAARPSAPQPPARTLLPLLKLNANTCRWPIGDPLLPGFGFCGDHVAEGSVYCAAHKARAVSDVVPPRLRPPHDNTVISARKAREREVAR